MNDPKYRYQFKIGNKIVHGGITNDLDRPKAPAIKSRSYILKALTPGRYRSDRREGNYCQEPRNLH